MSSSHLTVVEVAGQETGFRPMTSAFPKLFGFGVHMNLGKPAVNKKISVYEQHFSKSAVLVFAVSRNAPVL